MLGVNGDRWLVRFSARVGRECVVRLLANGSDCEERRYVGAVLDSEADGRAEELLILLVLCAEVNAIVACNHAGWEYGDVCNRDITGSRRQSDVELDERSAVAEHFDTEVVYADVPLAARYLLVKLALQSHRHVDAGVRRPDIRFARLDLDMIAVLAAVLVRE